MSKIIDKAVQITANGIDKDLKTALEDGSLAPSVLDQTVSVYKPVLNTFTAVISTDSVNAISVASQTGGFISSVGIPSDRRYNINFTSGYFNVVPSVQVTAQDSSGATRVVPIASLTTTSMQVFSSPDDTGITRLFVTVEKQGADYIDPLTSTQEITIPMTQAGLIQEEDLVTRCAGNGGTAVTADVTNIPFIVQQDTVGAWNGSQFTVPETGVYALSGHLLYTASTTRGVDLYVNGSIYRRVGDVLGSNINKFDITDQFTAGQVLSIRSTGGGTLVNNALYHYLNITKQGTLKQVNVNPHQKATIATSEVRFEGASTRGSTATAIVRFDNVARLRGDHFELNPLGDPAVHGTHIRMKKAGRLDVTASLANNVYAYITRNQQNLTANPSTPSERLGTSGATATNFTASPVWVGDVAAGDIFRLCSDVTPTANLSNSFRLYFQELEVAVSVTNTLPQFSESDLVVRCAGNGGQAITDAFTNIPFNVISDNTGAWSGSQFVVPESGLWSIAVSTYFTTTAQRSMNVYLNGNQFRRIGEATTFSVHTGAITEQFTQGDVISIRTNNGAGTLLNDTRLHYLNITKVGKPNVTGVDVTPFVRLPMPVSQSSKRINATVSTGTVIGALTASNGSSIYSYNSTTGVYTVLKRARFNLNITLRSDTSSGTRADIALNGVNVGQDTSPSLVGGWATASWNDELNVGDTFTFASAGAATNQHVSVLATANHDNIVTPIESFSTDTAPLTYAPSSVYTLTTLANAPVGTYITFTYAANTNTRTQTTTRPDQTDADMQANGFHVSARPYSSASVATHPACFAIQIGKGHKGLNLGLYKAIGKVTSGELDFVLNGDSQQYGASSKSYNEITGILVVDVGLCLNAANSFYSFRYSDGTNQTNGYLVVNASKSPALAGIPDRDVVAVRAVQSSGQSIPHNTITVLTWDTSKTYDTHNALNPSTGVFTSTKSARYKIDLATLFTGAAWTAGNLHVLYIYKNGVAYSMAYRSVQAAGTFNVYSSLTDSVRLNAGDTLDFRIVHTRGSSTVIQADAVHNHVVITEEGGN
jgi:hypothetical protein